MPGSIYLIQGKGKLVEMNEEDYKSEDLLQTLLADYPNLLAGDQIDSEVPRRWLLIRREIPIPSEEEGAGRWALDHLFLDQDGIPTLVEVKRSTDSRIRREVVGQMLDYAANAVVYWPVETVVAHFEKTCATRGQLSAEVLREFLGPDVDQQSFWQKVEKNLETGNVRMLFVADEIPRELKRIIEFLNEQMNPAEVLGVEIKQFSNGELKTLVPRVIGLTSDAEQKKAGGRETKEWDETSFFAALEANRGREEVDTARKILKWAQTGERFVYWGRGKETGAFVPQIRHKDRNHQFFHVTTYEKIYLPFSTYLTKEPFSSEEKRLELLSKLNSFLNEKIPTNAIDRYPTISLSILGNKGVLEEFLKTFEWFAEEVKAV